MKHSYQRIIGLLVLLIIWVGRYWQRSTTLDATNTDEVSDPMQVVDLTCRQETPVIRELSQLTPSVSLTECRIVNHTDQDIGIVRWGCRLPYYSTYKVEDWPHLLNVDEFVEYFAPVENEQEALAFAMALTPGVPQYNFAIPADWRAFVDEFNPTQVITSGDNYIINLYEYKRCWCGPHTHSETTYLITPTGDIQTLATIPVYENPAEDDLCLD